MRFVFLLLALAGGLAAQFKWTADELMSFVTSSLQNRFDDRQIADYLKKVRLTERISDEKLERFKTVGAGPKTMAALAALRDSAAALPPPAPPVPPPAPAEPPPAPEIAEQKKILAETREYALNYLRELPNFICLQVTRRYVDPTGMEYWKLDDTVNEQLSYFEQKETYKVNSVNDKPVNVQHDQLNGTTSSGEFGSTLRQIFDPKTETDFQWERWATLFGRRMHVFSFRVSQALSGYRLDYRRVRQYNTGYQRLIYVDRETGKVMRIKLESEKIPPDFPIQYVSVDLSYNFTKIGETEYLLPLKAELRSKEGKFLTRNDVEFRMYRKFGSESSIKFDTPDPLPEDATKEQPIGAPAKPEAAKPKPENRND